MNKILLFLSFVFCSVLLNAQQNIGIGTTSPDPSASLDVVANDKGVLFTRIDDTLNISNPATGLLIYHTPDSTFRYFDGIIWRKIFATGVSELNNLSSDTDVDSAVLAGFTLIIYEDGNTAIVNLQSIADSAVNTVYSNIADTLLNNQSFIDSLIAQIGDSIDDDIDSAQLVGYTLSIYEDGSVAIVNLQSIADSAINTVYSNIADTLLNNQSFIDSLIAQIGDSIDDDIDSATIAGFNLSIYEDGSIAVVNLQSMADSIYDFVFTNIADTLLNNQNFIDSLIAQIGDSIDDDIDSASIVGYQINIYEDASVVTVSLQSVVDSIFSQIDDSLLNNQTFIDSLIAQIGDSIDDDIDSASINGYMLSIYEDDQTATVNLQSLVDSATSIVYTNISDTLLGDNYFIDSLTTLFGGSDDDDIDSANLIGYTLNIYEDASIATANLQPIADSAISTVYNNIADTLLNNSYFTDSISNLAGDHDFYEEGTTSAPDNINDKIYTFGNVGLGTATPSAYLHVHAASHDDPDEIFKVSTGPLGNLLVVDEVGNADLLEDMDIGGDATVTGKTTTNTFRMINGGTIDYILRSDATGNGSWVDPASLGLGGGGADVDWYEVGGTSPPDAITDNIYKTSGNVGIGSNNPSNKLAVAGNINVTSEAYAIKFGNVDAVHFKGLSNTVVGLGALPGGAGQENTVVGEDAMALATTARRNVAIGGDALGSITTQTGNTVIGDGAMRSSTTSSSNIAVGADVGVSLNGVDNVLMGVNVALNATSGDRNTILGDDASNSATNLGNDNVYLGANAGDGAGAKGDNNAFLGANSGSNNTGSNNIMIGPGSGTSGSGSFNVFLGTNAGSGTSGSNKLIIHSASVLTSPLVYGEFDNRIFRIDGSLQVDDPSASGYAFPLADGSNGQVMYTDGNGQLVWSDIDDVPGFAGADNLGNHIATQNIELNGRYLSNDGDNEGIKILDNGNVGIGVANPTYKLQVAGKIKTNAINELSDQRYKENIVQIEHALNKVLALRGVTYNWKTEEYAHLFNDTSKQLGFIAQEIESILPEVVETDQEGYKSVDYSHMVALLVEAIKDQQKVILNQQEQYNELKSELNQKVDKADVQDMILEQLKQLESSSAVHSSK